MTDALPLCTPPVSEKPMDAQGAEGRKEEDVPSELLSELEQTSRHRNLQQRDKDDRGWRAARAGGAKNKAWYYSAGL